MHARCVHAHVQREGGVGTAEIGVQGADDGKGGTHA